MTGSVHLQCLDGRLVVSATNFNTSVQESLPAQTKDFPAILTPAVRLYDVVRKLDSQGRLTLSIGGGAKKSSGGDTNLHVQSGRTRFTLVMSSPNDFLIPPYAPSVAKTSNAAKDATMRHVELDRARLHLLFEATFFAASQDETREYLNGVYLHTVARGDTNGSGFYLRTVATDGHRMAISDVDFSA